SCGGVVNRFDRREFLRHLLTAAGLTVSPFDRLAFGTSGIAAPQQPRRIVIVGAGLAGLVAAHELLKAGNQGGVVGAALHPGGWMLSSAPGVAFIRCAILLQMVSTPRRVQRVSRSHTI